MEIGDRIILQWIVSETWRCRTNSTSSGQFPLSDCCGQRDEVLKFVNGREYLYKVHNSRLPEGKLHILNLSVAVCFILPSNTIPNSADVGAFPFASGS